MIHPYNLRWCGRHSPLELDRSVAVHCPRVLRGHRHLYRALPVESTPAASSTRPLFKLLRCNNSSRETSMSRGDQRINLALFKDPWPPSIIAVHLALVLPRVGCEVAELLEKATDKWKSVVIWLGMLANAITALLWRDSGAGGEETRSVWRGERGRSWIVELRREILWIRIQIYKFALDSSERPVLLRSGTPTGYSFADKLPGRRGILKEGEDV